MDSDEEDSAEEDDEGGSPASTENGIFDVDDPGFEGWTSIRPVIRKPYQYSSHLKVIIPNR